MIVVKRLLCVVFTIVAVLAMAACDSSNKSSGGGTTPAAKGYSKASLAGTWNLYTTRKNLHGVPMAPITGAMRYDADGNLLKARSSGCGSFCNDDGTMRMISANNRVVNADGTTTSQSISQCGCWVGGTMAIRTTVTGRFISPDRIEEKGRNIVFDLVTGQEIGGNIFVRVWKKR